MFEQKSSAETYEAEKKAEDCTIGDVTDIRERTRVLAAPLAAVLVLFGVIFAVDLVTPLGIEIWVLWSGRHSCSSAPHSPAL
jgi:hypothetical protein